jgi:hypothetical protein
VRLVSKCWRDLVAKVWHSKQTLKLNEESIVKLTSLTSQQINRKSVNFQMYAAILNKVNSNKLLSLEISTSNSSRQLLSVYDFAKILDLASHKCTHLQSLTIKSSAKYKLEIFPNNSFAKLIRHCPNLTHVDLKNSFGLVDLSVEVLFDSCPQLKSLNLTNCNLIIGICFKKVNKALRKITLDYCSNIREENVVKMLNQNRSLTFLSLNGVEIGPRVFYYVINNLKMLQVLRISKHDFDYMNSFFSAFKETSEQFANTSLHLTKLDLSNNLGNNHLFASILKNCASLKSLNVDYCKNLSDDMFTSFGINAPLEQLHLTGLNITDTTLQTLGQIKSSLKRLVVNKCRRLTSRGLGLALERLSALEVFEVQQTLADNFVLFMALNLARFEPKRCVRILGQETQLDVFELNILYPDNKMGNGVTLSNLVKFCPLSNEQYSTEMAISYKFMSVELTRPEFLTIHECDWQKRLES